MYHARIHRHVIGAALLLATSTAWAQVSLSSGHDRWFFGGGLGVGFGDVSYVTLSPFAGYRVTDQVSVGVGLQYRYRNDTRFGRDLSTTDVGTSVFARYQVFGPFFVHGEYEYLNYQYYRSDLSKTRTGVSSFLVGGGVSQQLNRNASFYAMVLYNLSYSSYDSVSPYSSPWSVRAGIGISF
ncbi:MAG: hypothetical protein GC151_01645 [Betaproteobacteria bacterium]|nr:hypothetical protein [Betaproteobacteria bacterium]